MKHILLIWELGGNRGHLERLQVVAQALKKQGHAITFIVRDLEKSRQWLEERGWPFIAAPRSNQSHWGSRTPSCHADWYLVEGFHREGVANQLIQQWQFILKQTQADAALLDYAPFAAYALHFHGIPFTTLGSGFCSPTTHAPAQCFKPWDASAVQQAKLAQHHLAHVFKALAQQLGSRAAHHMHDLFTQERLALCLFEEMDHFARPASSHRFYGAIWASQKNQSVQWSEQASLPKVFCYLNGQGQDILTILNQLRATPVQTIAVAPKISAEEAAALSSAHFQISTQPLDAFALLAQAQVCITHGGLALSAMSLQQGVPLLILPQYVEQVLLARQLKKYGLAVACTLPRAARGITDLLTRMLGDSGYHHRAQTFAQKYRHITPESVVSRVLQAAPWNTLQEKAA